MEVTWAVLVVVLDTGVVRRGKWIGGRNTRIGLGDLRNVYAAGYRADVEIREVVVKWNLM
jgi:hypothetical protein